MYANGELNARESCSIWWWTGSTRRPSDLVSSFPSLSASCRTSSQAVTSPNTRFRSARTDRSGSLPTSPRAAATRSRLLSPRRRRSSRLPRRRRTSSRTSLQRLRRRMRHIDNGGLGQ